MAFPKLWPKINFSDLKVGYIMNIISEAIAVVLVIFNFQNIGEFK